MHSPATLRQRLTRQWENHNLREQRLLDPASFPFSLPIGKPSPKLIATDLDALRNHLKQWRDEKHGTVIWQTIPSRHSSEPIKVPTHWQIDSLDVWIEAARLSAEARPLLELLDSIHPRYHTILIRQRSLWKNRPLKETIQACQLCDLLEPGIAKGAPLRALSIAGIDTKFFERHRNLIVPLLDLRFDGQISQFGLETFLDATHENPHWVLVVDLGKDLLPFHQQRVSTSEIANFTWEIPRVLIIENENCLHLLPPLRKTLAILGAGLDLSWLKAPFLHDTQVSYWGDLDTWGLQMLSTARQHLPSIEPLLMHSEILHSNIHKAVPEPNPAPTTSPQHLTQQETELYQYLLTQTKGRLEQEFIPASQVHSALQSQEPDMQL